MWSLDLMLPLHSLLCKFLDSGIYLCEETHQINITNVWLNKYFKLFYASYDHNELMKHYVEGLLYNKASHNVLIQ